MQIDTTERHIMENRGSRHTLIIRKVHPQDFGNYSCVGKEHMRLIMFHPPQLICSSSFFLSFLLYSTFVYM